MIWYYTLVTNVRSVMRQECKKYKHNCKEKAITFIFLQWFRPVLKFASKFLAQTSSDFLWKLVNFSSKQPVCLIVTCGWGLLNTSNTRPWEKSVKVCCMVTAITFYTVLLCAYQSFVILNSFSLPKTVQTMLTSNHWLW